jgi:sugar lactone lactonase YvrE
LTQKNRFLIVTATILAALLVFSSATHYVRAFQSGESASLVLGQPDFASNSYKVSASGLSSPEGVAFDPSGNLWVADSGSSRVLEYTLPLTTGESASIVIGQENYGFNSSQSFIGQTGLDSVVGITFDKSGDLWVTDSQNNRVLEFKPPFSSGENASIVIGQSSFLDGTQNLANQSTLYSPFGVAFDSSGNLWVSDSGFSRVLEYRAPFTNFESASLVLGQQNFTGNFTTITQASIGHPGGMVFDSSANLWVSDRDNKRVLKFASPFSTGESASLVLGSSDFTSVPFVLLGTATQSAFGSPQAVTFDHSGNLWVTDQQDNRVLGFAPPFSNGENATLVIGQTNFTSTNSSATASGLSGPEGITTDASGNLWVDDTRNNRVLEFAPGTTGVSSSLSTSSSSSTTTVAPLTSSAMSTSSSSSFSSSSQQSSISASSSAMSITSSSSSSNAVSLTLSYVLVPTVVILVGVSLLVGSILRTRKK